ncbi:MAG TPA: hypothetical protein PKC60_00005 [Hydrogenophaga sp.]|nr:hypothetical protein [Hydrogenophaga sp.]HMN91588.1 hypothetical protein [Hydrogenophaga sp.]
MELGKHFWLLGFGGRTGENYSESVPAPGVDTPQDLERVRALVAAKPAG